MVLLDIKTTKGIKQVPAYTVSEFKGKNLVGIDTCRKRIKKRWVSYYNIGNAYDIETTTINGENPYAFMYIWQICVCGYLVIGRTIDEYQELIRHLQVALNLSWFNRLVLYVHNLSYEYMFIKDFFNFGDVFARKANKIVTAECEGIEYRCSYFLSNMSLEKFLENTDGCIYRKYRGGKFDYTKTRTPDTELSDYELSYSAVDVLGLADAINKKLKDDTIATIPLTSTGYVRRTYRNAMRKNPANYDKWQSTRFDADTYRQAKFAYRGGNTHANRRFSDKIVRDVFSYDLQSSYPYVMMAEYVPVSSFRLVKLKTKRDIYQYVDKYCCLFDLELFEISTNAAIPYIDIAHCQKRSADIVDDNGRVLGATYVKLSVTEIDFKIIKDQYNLNDDQIYISNLRYAKRGLLPPEFRQTLLDFYVQKTELKGVKEMVYEYGKSKNIVNASYGMTVTDIVNPDYVFNITDKKWEKNEIDIETAITKFYSNRNNFLSYMYGVWICAQARKRLQELIDIIGKDVVYVDTDSVKFVNHKLYKSKIISINDYISKKCMSSDIPFYATKDNEKYIMGIWDYDGYYYEFKTLGAKKYAYTVDGILYITVSGMDKRKGARQLKKLNNFKIGWSSYNVGRTTAFYNHEPIHYINVDGCRIKTASNIALVDSTYTIGITDQYYDLLYGDNYREVS